MDLRAESQRLRLDLLAVQVCDALARAGVPCVLLKGPTTSVWLYSPPRPYSDVDVLVPPSRSADAARALAAAGVASAVGRPTTDAKDNWLLHSTEGFEVDLHLTLPAMDVHGDAVWERLEPHVVRFDTGVGTVPALDLPARCAVLALHALNSDVNPAQPLEDLRRGRAAASSDDWEGARLLLRTLDSEDLLAGGLSLVEPVPGVSPRARLYLDRAPSAAFGLERLLRAKGLSLLPELTRAVFPTREYLRQSEVDLEMRRTWLLRGYVRRWSRIVRQLPRAVSAVFEARRGAERKRSRMR